MIEIIDSVVFINGEKMFILSEEDHLALEGMIRLIQFNKIVAGEIK